MEIRTRYVARTVTVILPGIITIIGIFLVPFLVHTFLKTDSFLLKLGANLGGFAALVALVILTNPFFVALAKNKPGTLSLDGPVMGWHAYGGPGTLDLTKPHSLLISAGPGLRAGPSVSVYAANEAGFVNLCLHGMQRERAVSEFPDDDFHARLSIPPEEGSGGFVLILGNTDHGAFVKTVLETAWKHREHNKAYAIYRQFPWTTPPSPEAPSASRVEEDMVETLKEQAYLTVGESIWVLPSHVLVRDGGRFTLFPMGYVSVKSVTVSGVAGTTPRVTFTEMLEFSGLDDTGEELRSLVPPHRDTGEESNDDYYRELFLRTYLSKYAKVPS